MELSDGDARELQRLEERLLDPQVRAKPGAVAVYLAEDFCEIGRSGQTYDRQQVLDAIGADGSEAALLHDFRARSLAPDIALVTYTTSRPDAGVRDRTLRSSIWVRSDGRWRMVFHQGTPAA